MKFLLLSIFLVGFTLGNFNMNLKTYQEQNNQFTTQPIVLKPEKTIIWKEFLGLNAQLLWFTPQQVSHQISMVKALGLEWVRVDLHWDLLEPTQNQFEFYPSDFVVSALKTANLKSLFYLVGSAPFQSSAPLPLPSNYNEYPPKNPWVFANRMGVLAKRYPSVNAWQIWNEPNIPSFWMPIESPIAYETLLKNSVSVLNQVSNEIQLIIGGMAYYSQMPIIGGLMLESLIQLNTFELNITADYHPYTNTPEGDFPQAQDFLYNSQSINQGLRDANVLNIWTTEWGWSSYSGPSVDQPIIGETGQADYLLRRLALMSAMDYNKTFIFTLSDLDSRASVRDRKYGLIDLNGNPKPAYIALANFLNITGPEIIPGNSPSFLKNAGEFSISWIKPNGNNLWFFWTIQPGNNTIQLNGIQKATLYQPLLGTSHLLSPSQSVLFLNATQQLQILEWT